MIRHIRLICVCLLVVLISGCGLELKPKSISEVKFQLDGRTFIGKENAPNTVVVIQDYECESCKVFYNKTYKAVLENEVVDGNVKVYEFNLGFESEVSYLKAMLGIAINEKYPELKIELNKWSYEMDVEKGKKLLDKVFLKQELLNKFGKDYDFNNIVEKVFSDDVNYKKQLEKNGQIVDYLGINSVPKVYVNGLKMNTPESYDEFKSLLYK